MAFCSFSSESIIKNSVSIDNLFINEFLPIAPDYAVKVYLFGLYNCNNTDSLDNTLESFARILNLNTEDVLSSFYYWQDLGLVQVLNANPIEIKYLPVSRSSASLMKFNKDKYKDFNLVVQEILKSRLITPTEYNEYYYLIESLHIEVDALILIIQYCAKLKGNDIGYKYILTIAKNWAYQGLTTVEKVEERLLQQQANDSEMKLILKTLGIKRAPSLDDYELYLTWTQELGFDNETIIGLSKILKQKKQGINRLNSLLVKFYQMRIISLKEIKEYLDKEDELYNIAKTVCKNIGTRYDNLEIVVETYVNNWVSLGFDDETLSFISLYCFKNIIRTLAGVDKVVNKFYKLGLLTQESINSYIEEGVKLDAKISEILTELGIMRLVNMYDREFYNTWIYDWQISQELLDYAVSQSKGKIQSMQFLNKLLSIYHNKNITTVEQAKTEKIEFLSSNAITTAAKSSPSATRNRRPEKREYTKEELNSLFTSIEEVEL